MQRVEIWLNDRDVRDARLEGLIGALRAAHVGARLCARPEDGTVPDNALLWQQIDDTRERIGLLTRGARDVIGPWMHEGEALARSLVHLRANEPCVAATSIRLGDLEIDCLAREAWRQGLRLGLLQREFELLHFLANHPNAPQSRDTLLRAVWRLNFDPGTNVVEVHISRLRAKLDHRFDRSILRTIKGAGYALVSGAPGTPLAPPRESRHI